MLRFVPDHVKTKKMCENAVKQLPFLMYIPDRYQAQEICHKVISEKGETLNFLPDCCKNQKMCDKAVDNYTLHWILLLKCCDSKNM